MYFLKLKCVTKCWNLGLGGYCCQGKVKMLLLIHTDTYHALTITFWNKVGQGEPRQH